MKILVLGAAGQLGTAIADRYASRGEVVRATRTDVDLADSAALEQFVTRQRPDVLINCAAYNNVDGAEDHPVEAIRVNATAVRALARAAATAGSTIVHYGTDFVFDGTADRPYTEDD